MGTAPGVMIAAFSESLPEGRFSLVFVAFNTIFAPLTQEARVACFQGPPPASVYEPA